jgi:hypothetical protein
LRTQTVDDIAERIDRAGDRYHNAGHFKRENESRIAAGAIRGAGDANEAREIAQAFESGLDPGLNENGATLQLAGRSPRRPWWRRWGTGPTDDS